MPGILKDPPPSPPRARTNGHAVSTQNGEASRGGTSTTMIVSSNAPSPTTSSRTARSTISSTTRLPNAPTSLRVQMPVAQLMAEREAALRAGGRTGARAGAGAGAGGNGSGSGSGSGAGFRYANTRAVRASSSGSATAPSTSASASAAPPSSISTTTDAQILSASVLGQRQQARSTLGWQEKLMDEEGVGIDVLREGLTHLSNATWLQVLQERSLSNVCAYPTCSNAPCAAQQQQQRPQRRMSAAPASPDPPSDKPHPHALLRAAAARALPPSAPRYRISLRTRTVRRDTSSEPGGRDTFCSEACWRRAEWVRRWVFGVGSGKEVGAKGDKGEGEGEDHIRGGRWETLVNRGGPLGDWRNVELLEDVEEREATQGRTAQVSNGLKHESVAATAAAAAAAAEVPEANDAISRGPPAQSMTKKSADQSRNKVESLIANLTITERPPGRTNVTAASTNSLGTRASAAPKNGTASVAALPRTRSNDDSPKRKDEAVPPRPRSTRSRKGHLSLHDLLGHDSKDDDDDDDDGEDRGDAADAAEELARMLLGSSRQSTGSVPGQGQIKLVPAPPQPLPPPTTESEDGDAGQLLNSASEEEDSQSDSDSETEEERRARRLAQEEEDRAFEHALQVRDEVEAGGVRVRGEAKVRKGEVR